MNQLIKEKPRKTTFKSKVRIKVTSNIDLKLKRLATSQKAILQQITALNIILKNGHKKYYKCGFLYDNELTDELLSSLTNVLYKNIGIFHFGFNLPENQIKKSMQSVLMKKYCNPQRKPIQKRLEESYIQKIHQYYSGGHYFARKHIKADWTSLLKDKAQTISQYLNSQQSDCQTLQNFNSFQLASRILNRSDHIKDKFCRSSTAEKQYKHSQMQKDLEINQRRKQQLKATFNKCKLGSVWVPPSDYPQLLGCFTYSVKRDFVLRLHRYCFLRQALCRNLFDGLLEWAEIFLKLPLNCIEVIASKVDFASKWEKVGWILFACHRDDIYLIRYLRLV